MAPTWTGKPAVMGGSEPVRMMLLTFASIGISFVWGMEMTYCTPYLLNLGLSKANTSLVWIAGPLSGLIVQPIVGVLADDSKSKWGRRRPLMLAGAAIVAVGLTVLGFSQELMGLFTSDVDLTRRISIAAAVVAIYMVDFAINIVMSCSRSLMVDTLPVDKQQDGAAWYGRMSAVGHMIGYAAGAVNLVDLSFGILGSSQFQALTVLSTLVMLLTVSVTCFAVTERVLVSSASHGHEAGNFKVFRQILSTLRHMPPRIKTICFAQFWSWIGWFPFLFYNTTWVGETYFRYDDNAKNSKDVLGDMGRIGSTALVIYSIITFAGAFFLPLMVNSPGEKDYTRRPPEWLSGVFARMGRFRPDLMTTWFWSHIVFAVAMSMAPFATSFRFATFLICLCGLPWTVALWAPIAFLGIEVNELSLADAAAYRRLSDSSTDSSPTLHVDPDPESNTSSPSGELSGVYFGILNIFTTLPQFIATFISTIVFAIFEPGKSPELSDGDVPGEDKGGVNAISICLFIGAISALMAARTTWKLKTM